MLTRLKVSGFKNLLDLDVQFSPFTCIAGPNGVGKSNLFDAIRFISLVADQPLMEAAGQVRDAGRRARDIRGLFYRSGDYVAPSMDFEMEMIVPATVVDDFGQEAKATITTLRYAFSVGYRGGNGSGGPDQLIVLNEELRPLPKGEAPTRLGFPHTRAWRDSVVAGRRASELISTDPESRTIKVHQDAQTSKGRGRPNLVPTANLRRTVLSASNSAENPTILAARREMQSWIQLQLEPSALRKPDEFTDPQHLTASGEHMPAVLDRLARTGVAEDIYAMLANRLAELVGDVRDVRSVRDEARDLITVQLRSRDGTPHPASALSDGTLRFLALSLLELDPEFRGLLCLEEPENGIHPERIPAMIQLLKDLATDANFAVSEENPLRQVIVNTHSPACVSEVDDPTLLYAAPVDIPREGHLLPTVSLRPLDGTWRDDSRNEVTSRGVIQRYLRLRPAVKGGTRVIDRPDLQIGLDFGRDLSCD